MKYSYHKDGTKPVDGEILVFGSNLIGVHGAGAARLAMDEYGAEFGKPVGRFGMSYAIPTKDETIRNTLALEDIRPFVERFKDYAYNNPKLNFFVTRIGCGLAGYEDFQIAPLFSGSTENCNFPIDWKKYLE